MLINVKHETCALHLLLLADHTTTEPKKRHENTAVGAIVKYKIYRCLASRSDAGQDLQPSVTVSTCAG